MWDTTREKLIKRKKPDDISIWNYKAEMGIPKPRTVDILLSGIAQKCAQILAMKEPNSAMDRRLIENHSMHTHFVYDNKPIQLTSRSPYLLTCSQPLKRFATKQEVMDTQHGVIENIEPISPLVDLDISNIYKSESDIGYSTDYKHRYHHTLLLQHPKEWAMETRHSSALLMSYAHCLEVAKRVDTTNNLLNNPVCVQTIHTDGKSFGFTCFQLNTLVTTVEADSMGYSTRRNMAWVGDDLMYQKDVPRRSMLRDTKYRNYKPDVFRIILGMLSR